MKEYNAIDLFAGCGGLSLGLSRAGFKVLFANELNPSAAETYKHNLISKLKHKTILDVGDVCKLDSEKIIKAAKGKEIHLVAGGPPCQGFSMAGLRDPKDPRSKLFKQLVRIVSEIKPALFLMENVKGILSMDNGKVIKEIKESFEKIKPGYDVKIEVLKASGFGVPQKRERVFIIGTRIGNGVLHPTPSKEKPVTVKEAIDDLSFLEMGQSSDKYLLPPTSEYQKMMRKNSKEIKNHEAPLHSEKIVKRFSSLRPGQSAKDLPNQFKTKKVVLYRLDGDKPAKTVTTLPDDYIHYKKDRILTVREMARLQSFPDWFEFLGPRTTGGSRRKEEVPQYSQIGNAVPPLLSESVGRQLIMCLNIHLKGQSKHKL